MLFGMGKWHLTLVVYIDKVRFPFFLSSGFVPVLWPRHLGVKEIIKLIDAKKSSNQRECSAVSSL